MNALVSEKLRSLRPYEPDLAPCDIRLDANESFLDLPAFLRARIAEKAASVAFNRYPDPLACGVRSAFSSYYGVPASCVTAGNGSDELITLLLNTFVQKGDKVLLTRPDFSMYEIYAATAELTPVFLTKNKDRTLDADMLIETARREKVKMLLFSNPCNPTGRGLDRETVLKIIRSTGCLVVVDEAYMDFWDQPVLGCAPETENLIVLKTLSKIGFAAARLGFAVTGESLTSYLQAAKSPYNVNAMTQAAGEILLTEGKAALRAATVEIARSRASLCEALRLLEADFPGKLSVIPSVTNFVSLLSPLAARYHHILRERGVSVRQIGKDLLRITAGSKEENAAFLGIFRIILEEDAK